MMKRGRLGILLLLMVTSLFAMLPSASAVTAQQVIQSIITLDFLNAVGILPAGVTVNPIEGFTRFLLLILLFALLYKGTELLKLGNSVSVVIALVVSLLTVIFIPGTILLAAAASYGTLFSLTILSLPVLAGLALYFVLKDHPWIRAVVMLLLLLTVNEVQKYVGSWSSSSGAGYAPVITTVAEWFGIIWWVVLVLAIWTVLVALFGSSRNVSASDGEAFKDTLKWIGNKLGSSERRLRTREMNEYVEEEKELEMLEKVKEARDRALSLVQAAIAAKKIDTASEVTDIADAVYLVRDNLNNAKKEFRPLGRATGRTVSTSSRAFDAVKREKKKLAEGTMLRSEKDIKEIDVLEKQILKLHEEARNLVDAELRKYDAAIKSVEKVKRDAKPLPFNLFGGRASPSPSAPRAGGVPIGEQVNTALKNIVKNLTAVNISAIIDKQKAAATAMKGIVAETDDLLKFK